jgi:hypothetical protein
MHSDERLLRSQHSVVSESDTEKGQAEENDKEKEKESCMIATSLFPPCSMPVCLAAVKMKLVAEATPAVPFFSRQVRGRSGELGLWCAMITFTASTRMFPAPRTRSM